MDRIDREKAERVWQRVKGEAKPMPERPPAEGLPEMIAAAWTDGAEYLLLAKKLKDSPRLRHMAQQKKAQCDCLKGIYTLKTGKAPAVKAVPPEVGELAQSLRRCYGRSKKSFDRYEARSTDPEYGPVFASLALQEQEICRSLLEMLGGNGK